MTKKCTTNMQKGWKFKGSGKCGEVGGETISLLVGKNLNETGEED